MKTMPRLALMSLMAASTCAAESMIDLLRGRVEWPAALTLTCPVVVKFEDGEIRLNKGVAISADTLLHNGDLVVKVSGQWLAIPFDCTDLASKAALGRPAAGVNQPDNPPSSNRKPAWVDVSFDVEKIVDEGVIARAVSAVSGEQRRPHKMPPRIYVRMDTRGLPETAKLTMRLWAVPAREGINLPCYSTAEPR